MSCSGSITEMNTTPQQCSGVEVDSRLWALAVSGMDEVHPAPDRATAQLWAMQHTVLMHNWRPNPRPMDPIVSFTVCEWPWSPESHREGLDTSIKANTRPEQSSDATLTAHAQALLDAGPLIMTREEFNRICAKINARAKWREILG